MANQRDKNKKLVGGYVHKTLKARFAKVAKAEGKNEKDLMEEFIKEGLERRRAKHPEIFKDRPGDESTTAK